MHSEGEETHAPTQDESPTKRHQMEECPTAKILQIQKEANSKMTKLSKNVAYLKIS